VTPMDLMTRMIEHHVWLTGEMIDRAARLSDEQLDAPIEVPIGTIDRRGGPPRRHLRRRHV